MKKEVKPEYKQGTDYFSECYSTDFNNKYVWAGKDVSLYANLIKQGLHLFTSKLEVLRGQFKLKPQQRLFKLQDKQCYTIPILSNCWNELVVQRKSKKRWTLREYPQLTCPICHQQGHDVDVDMPEDCPVNYP